MRLNELYVPKGATHSKKRVGRGSGSGHGKTSSRGQNGQNSRSGGGVRPGFEGGQMPLMRRIPKRGFTPVFRQDYAVVNLKDLDLFEAGSTVDVETLIENGFVRSLKDRVKVLAKGELTKKLTVKAHAFSASAKAKIEQAGGSVELLS